MLETIREYAQEVLSQSPEAEQVATLHLNYFSHLSAEAEQALRGSTRDMWMVRCDDELPNIRKALSWAQNDTAQWEAYRDLAERFADVR